MISQEKTSKKKRIKALTEEFYEQLIMTEMRLKKEFSMECLQEVVNLYTRAIEYFESVEDQRYKDYQNRMNVLLSQPDILKKMNDYYLRNKEKKSDSDLEKKQKFRMNFISQINSVNVCTDKVKTLLESKKDPETGVMDKDLENQDNTFKSRLEEKRRKKNTFTSLDLKSFDDTEISTQRFEDLLLSVKSQYDSEKKSLMDQKFDDDEKFSPISLKNRTFFSKKEVSIFKFDDNLSDSKHLGPKHRQAFVEIRKALEIFVNEFNVYFYEHMFQRFTDNVHKLLDEKYNKYIEISKNYQGQIKEMEFIITGGDGDDMHQESIKNIIDSLKEEQEHELDRIDDYYNNLISEAQANFKSYALKANPGIQLIEEKFKLDMYTLINSILVPKKI